MPSTMLDLLESGLREQVMYGGPTTRRHMTINVSSGVAIRCTLATRKSGRMRETASSRRPLVRHGEERNLPRDRRVTDP
jgi:hypothetical protein